MVWFLCAYIRRALNLKRQLTSFLGFFGISFSFGRYKDLWKAALVPVISRLWKTVILLLTWSQFRQIFLKQMKQKLQSNIIKHSFTLYFSGHILKGTRNSSKMRPTLNHEKCFVNTNKHSATTHSKNVWRAVPAKLITFMDTNFKFCTTSKYISWDTKLS